MTFVRNERYSMGWSDPRGIFGNTDTETSPYRRIPDDIMNLSIKACRDIYTVRMGDAPVEVSVLRDIPIGDPLSGIIHRLTDAGELVYEVDKMPNRVRRVETYRLKAEYGDN